MAAKVREIDALSEYDAPFFKVLARNDTGETRSHQAGLVLPKALSVYFPHLVVGVGPTSDRDITAEVYEGPSFLATVATRYQIQTWHGTRSPEHRLTRNLRVLLDRAHAGDILKFERKLGYTDHYRLTLLHQDTHEHQTIVERVGTNYGLLTAQPPADQSDFKAAEASIQTDLSKPFTPFEQPKQALTMVQRRVRVELFKTDVRVAYGNACALCKLGLRTPAGDLEVEAAHIIPYRLNGANDPRNGIALCQTHHWAFDNHMWTLTREHRVFVPTAVRNLATNKNIESFSGLTIRRPVPAKLAPALPAVEHHHAATIQQWGL